MSAARLIFCERISTIRGAIIDFNLRDLPPIPTNSSHNNSARVIRNGLAVQCFNIFEDFVKARVEEILAGIATSGVLFNHLPMDLQWAATVGSVKAIEQQLKIREKAVKIRYVQDVSEKISSTKTTAFFLTEIAFFHAASNISKDHFKDALNSFGVDKPWLQISGLCSRLGISGLPAETVFESFAQRRHSAAHKASTSVSETDLTQSVLDAVGLAICFDVLITKAAKIIGSLNSSSRPNAALISNQAAIPLRIIKYFGSSFSERKEGTSSNVQTSVISSALIPNATNRANAENGFLVVYDKLGHPDFWNV